MLNERRAKIRDYIDTHNEATLKELAELCGNCSSMTLWRDLNALENEGAIRRTRGGALSMRSIQPEAEGLYSQRAQQNTLQKRTIARAAEEFVLPSHAVYLDAGSTIMELAKRLKDQHYTIITSGANIAIELSQRRSCSVIALGGQISGNTLSFSGAQAEALLDLVNIETAVMATSGYSKTGGFTSGSFSESEIKRKVIAKAAKVIMLMDKSKLDRSLPFTFATLKDIDILITDSPLSFELMLEAKDANVEVLVAKEN
ncbi:MAG TPA: DeoR/GlpR family DNA-binding transcription regulator [Clostridia bacterium]|nr:DeoR/GlpR family DNA-binding transcription regulator [Clostridia bacterium]